MFTDVEKKRFASHVSGELIKRYGGFVERADLIQELLLDAYANHDEYNKWHLADEGHRVTLAMFGHGKMYAERQKAEASGYSVADVAWYNPDSLRDLIPIAVDAEWDGLTGQGEQADVKIHSAPAEGGTLMTMVVDIRKALDACPAARHDVSSYDEDSDEYRNALITLSEWLGGAFPNAGRRRKVLTNTAAISLLAHE